jgi:hypothetical protein
MRPRESTVRARAVIAWATAALVLAALACPVPPSVATADATQAQRGDAWGAEIPSFENAPPLQPAIAHESRGLGTPRPPAQRDVLAERLADATIVQVSTALRTPTLGIDVPSCQPVLRWCVAHATATSPA